MLLERIFGIFEERGINNPTHPLNAAGILEFLGLDRKSTAGVTLNKEALLGVPAFWRGVRLLGDNVGKLPIKVWRRLTAGGKELDSEHQGNIIRRPNEQTTQYEFVRLLTSHAVYRGNGFAYINRMGNGDPAELIQLDPEQVSIVSETTTQGRRLMRRITYGYKIGLTGGFKFSPRDVLHIKNLSHEGLIGLSAQDLFESALGISVAKDKYQAAFFGNQARPDFVILFPNRFESKEHIDRFRHGWSNAHQGPDKAHGIGVLEHGATLQQLQNSAEQMQLAELDERDLIRIANIVGVPAYKLGANISTSYSSLEQENRNFLNDSIAGWLCGWKQELEKKLLSEDEQRSDSHIIEAQRDELERADRATEIEAAERLVNSGLHTADELRARWNLPPLPDGQGSKPRIPLNIGILGELDDGPAEPVSEETDDDATRFIEPPALPAPEGNGVLQRCATKAATAVVNRLSLVVEKHSKRRDKFRNMLASLRESHLPALTHEFSPFMASTTAECYAAELLHDIHEQLRKLEQVATSTQQLRSSAQQIMAGVQLEWPSQITEALLEVA